MCVCLPLSLIIQPDLKFHLYPKVDEDLLRKLYFFLTFHVGSFPIVLYVSVFHFLMFHVNHFIFFLVTLFRQILSYRSQFRFFTIVNLITVKLDCTTSSFVGPRSDTVSRGLPRF